MEGKIMKKCIWKDIDWSKYDKDPLDVRICDACDGYASSTCEFYNYLKLHPGNNGDRKEMGKYGF
jgi:hypothetical protein